MKVKFKMTKKSDKNNAFGFESLLALPAVPATEFINWGHGEDERAAQPTSHKPSPFASEQQFRLCQAIAEHPMQPSSTYPKLAGISSKSAKQARGELLNKNFIREHVVDSGRRGRSSILLEALSPGIEAVRKYQEQSCL